MTNYREFNVEFGREIDLQSLRVTENISDVDFKRIHANSVIVTADALIRYDGGFLLLKRENKPFEGEWWFSGGRVQRGVSLEKSLRTKVKRETGLELGELTLLQHGRAFMREDPFNHGKGADTIGPVFLAEGKGKLTLDNTHSEHFILKDSEYDTVKDELHPFVRDPIEVALGISRPGRIVEYASESGVDVDPESLKTGFIADDLYKKIHRNMVVFTSDCLVYYNDGFLLLRRTTPPIADEWLFTGGRISRGVKLEEAIRDKINKECSLEVGPMAFLHYSREFYETDPFGHGGGTDTFGYKFVGVGKGDIKFDKDHQNFRIVRPERYNSIRNSLIPLTRHTIDAAINVIEIAKIQGISFTDYILGNARNEKLVCS